MLLDNHGDLILPARYYTYSGDHFNISSFAQSNDDVSNMSFYNASSSIFYDGGSVPPPDKPLALPLHDYSLNSIEGGLLLGFSSFGILISSFASLILLIGRNHKLIKSKSPIDIIVICMGCCILYGSMLLYLQQPSDFVCRARISMLLMGSMVIMAVLISKTLTKNILFGSNQKLTSLSIGKIVWGPRVLSLIFLAVQALLLAFWQRKTTLNAKITSTETFTFMICMGEKQESLTMMVLLYTFNFIVWLTLVVATLFSVRVHLETHNDTTALAFSSILLMAGLLLYQGISQYPNYFSDFVLCVIVWFITTALLCLDVLIHLQEAFVAKVLWPKQYLASKEGKSNQTKTTTSYHSLKTAAWSKALGNESMSCIYCIYFGKNSVRSKWYFGRARLFGLKGRSKLSLIFEDPKAVFSVQIHSCDDVNLIQSQVMITRKVSRQNVQVWIDFGSVQEAEIFHKELVENIWQILRNQ
ncbi:hypothetical protein BC830DRAFT_198718 [Chytriomyces sp. MP71]|nr:hypothetical protein BC830DRAFT_198718 [Chytriomyces sp. MP71]